MKRSLPGGPIRLFVGDAMDIGAIEDLARRLPSDAYGQVYVEVAAAIQIRRLSLPEGVGVTWLRRDRDLDAAGRMVRHGELAARATIAWLSEWMPETLDGMGDRYALWIGCSTSARVTRLYRELRERLGHERLHHPHYPEP